MKTSEHLEILRGLLKYQKSVYVQDEDSCNCCSSNGYTLKYIDPDTIKLEMRKLVDKKVKVLSSPNEGDKARMDMIGHTYDVEDMEDNGMYIVYYLNGGQYFEEKNVEVV